MEKNRETGDYLLVQIINLEEREHVTSPGTSQAPAAS